MKLRAFSSDYGFGFNVYVVREFGDQRQIAPPIDEDTLVDHGKGIVSRPTTTMTIEEAAELMDDLWRAGVRPTQRNREDYGAQTKHLEDMRALAFAKLGVPKP